MKHIFSWSFSFSFFFFKSLNWRVQFGGRQDSCNCLERKWLQKNDSKEVKVVFSAACQWNGSIKPATCSLSSWHTITQFAEVLLLIIQSSNLENHSVHVRPPNPQTSPPLFLEADQTLFDDSVIVFYQNLPSCHFTFSLHSSVALVFVQLSPYRGEGEVVVPSCTT